jgi:V/A-type H+-transporting ATPase subunit K
VNLLEMSLLVLALLVLVLLPFIPVYRGIITGKKAKNALIFNLVSFAAICILAVIIPIGNFVSAASTAAAVINPNAGLGYIAAALSIGISSIGAGIAVASGASSAIGATSEDPKMFGKAIIFVALGEGMALYGLLIAFMILGKL